MLAVTYTVSLYFSRSRFFPLVVARLSIGELVRLRIKCICQVLSFGYIERISRRYEFFTDLLVDVFIVLRNNLI